MIKMVINIILLLIRIFFHFTDVQFLLWILFLIIFEIKNILESVIKFVSPLFRIKMGTIHHNLHVSDLLNNINHV